MSRPSYALATRTKDKLGVVGQLVDGATSIVVTATCRPRDWFIFIDGTQFDTRSTNSSSAQLVTQLMTLLAQLNNLVCLFLAESNLAP